MTVEESNPVGSKRDAVGIDISNGRPLLTQAPTWRKSAIVIHRYTIG